MKTWQIGILYLSFIICCLICKEGMTSRDGVVYMQLGQRFYEGDYRAVFYHPQHPLTAVCIGSLMHLGCSALSAGLLLCVVAVALSLWAVKSLTELIYGEEASKWSLFFLVANPFVLTYATNILSDPLYWAGLWGGFFFFTRYWYLDKEKNMLWGGLSFGVAYLTRPEGLVLAVCSLALMLVLCLKHKKSLRPVAVGVAALMSMVLPLVWVFYRISGELHLSMKLDFLRKLGFGSYLDLNNRSMGKELIIIPDLQIAKEDDRVIFSEMSFLGKIENYFDHFVSNFFSVFYVLVVLLVIALCYKNKEVFRKGKIVFCLIFAMLLVLHLKWFDTYYLSRRHMIPLVFAVSIWSGPLFLLIKSRWNKKYVVLFLVLVSVYGVGRASNCYKSNEGRRKNFRVNYKDLGESLKNRPEPYLISFDNRIAWFAGNKIFLEAPLIEDPIAYYHKVEKVLKHKVIVVVNRRRPHNSLSFKVLDQGLLASGWKRHVEKENLISYVKN